MAHIEIGAPHIEIRENRCIGSGQCVLSASDVFDQDEDGFVVVLESKPTGADLDAARMAELICPSRSIRIVGENPKRG